VPRVIGIDPGSLSVDLCGLEDGRLFLERSLSTTDAFADPSILVRILDAAGPLDLVAGPSGYGLPLVHARDLSDNDLRLACLAAEGERGGIGGLRSVMRALGRLSTSVVLTPGVIHLPTVPAHRKVNRVDMGTADKVCAAALAIHDQARRLGCPERDVSLILLELGGAFTAALAVRDGAIVDGVGGSSGPLGLRAAGALDAEVAYLAGTFSKDAVFSGGAATIAGLPDAGAEALSSPGTPQGQVAWKAYLEGAVKAVVTMMVAVPAPGEIVLSGRVAEVAGVRHEIAGRLHSIGTPAPVRLLRGVSTIVKTAAQGAALLADGLAGGMSAALVAHMGIRDASGTVLDHLHVISAAAARKRLGILP
jgi:predicted butyrate kinase (DUF1464 family)